MGILDVTTLYNEQNLFYHAIYGTSKDVNSILQDVQDSLKPYQNFLRRSIDAEKERQIKAKFHIVEDEKTLRLEKQTLKFQLLSTGRLTFKIDPHWFEVINLHEIYENLTINFTEIDSIKLNFEDQEKYEDVPKSHFFLAQNQNASENESEDHLFIYFNANPKIDEMIKLKSVPLRLRKVIENLDQLLIIQERAELQIESIKEVNPGEYSVTYEGLLKKGVALTVNDFPCDKFAVEEVSNLENLQKVIRIRDSPNIEQEIRFTRYMDKNYVLIERDQYDQLKFVDKKGNSLSAREIGREPIDYINSNDRRLDLSEIDEGEYICSIFPQPNEIVTGSDGNRYRCNIKIKQSTEIKIQLDDEDENEKYSELAQMSDLEYFFEEDVEQVMGYPTFGESKNKGCLFDIVPGGKNRENRTLRIKTFSPKSYQHYKQKLEQMLGNGTPIFLSRNTYQLEMQEQFIDILINRPLKEYEPLLRLSENVDNSLAKWQAQFSDEEFEWEVLKDPDYEGTPQQREFVKKAISTPDFAFLEGPPGSGKTTAIIELIFQILKKNPKGKILLSASTHVAIDNVLEKIKKSYSEWFERILPIRVGDNYNISPAVKEFQINNIMGDREYEQEDISSLVLDSANLVCGTIIGILKHPWLQKPPQKGKRRKVFPKFDYLIIDECSKTTFQEFIIPALYAKKWVLVGDIQQLAPYAEQDYLKKFFEKLVDNESEIFPVPDQKANFFIFSILRDFLERDKHRNDRFCIPTENEVLNSLKDELYKRYLNYQSDPKILTKFPVILFVTKHFDTRYGNSRAFLQLEVDKILTGHPESLIITTPDVIFLDKDFLDQIHNYLPPSFMVLNVKGWESSQQYFRWRYHLKKIAKSDPEKLEKVFGKLNKNIGERTWASEISWRLIRLYELRNVSYSNRDYLKAIEFLLPRRVDLWRFIANAWCIALPSILESLQKGITDKYRYAIKSVLKYGFERVAPKIFSDRHVMLKFQFRMHKDISKFSSEKFYNSNALINSKFTRREWAYHRYNNSPYKSRFTWIDVKGTTVHNRNVQEAFYVMQELKKFVNWAKYASKEPENCDNDPNWTVAILTYYRGQERVLREKLREYTGQKTKNSVFNKDNIEIVLHTVDKIQGREADVVFISMVRTAKGNDTGNLGFMDNPNRLNVAITRAKYQLVILGQLYNFHEQDTSAFLRDLTDKNSITIEGIGYGNELRRTPANQPPRDADRDQSEQFISRRLEQSLRKRSQEKRNFHNNSPKGQRDARDRSRGNDLGRDK